MNIFKAASKGAGARTAFTFLLSYLALAAPYVKAQQKMRFISANSKVVDIRDDGFLQKGIWRISPEMQPDVFVAQRSKAEKTVTFYTDVDSISVSVKPGTSFLFGIILNHKDTAYTKVQLPDIKTLPFSRLCAACAAQADTIPFQLSFKNQIIIKGKINNSEPLDLLFDTGANGCGIFSAGLKESKGANVRFDGNTNVIGMGGSANVPTSSKNSLTLGNLKWKDIKLTYGNKGGLDGIIGYNVFDGMVVEINYDKRIIVLHQRPPAINKQYVKVPMKWHGELPFFPATLVNKGKRYTSWFSFDTGGSGALFINTSVMKQHQLYGTMEVIGKDELKGAGANLVKTETYLVPNFVIANVNLNEVTADVELPATAENLQWPIAGNDLLKRFNVFIDYQNDCFYFKPNQLLHSTYQHTVIFRIKLAASIILVVLLILAIYLIIRRRAKRRHAKFDSMP